MSDASTYLFCRCISVLQTDLMDVAKQQNEHCLPELSTDDKLQLAAPMWVRDTAALRYSQMDSTCTDKAIVI